MERLTKFDYENYRALKPKQDVVDNLGELEDILEKYDIESVEELEDYLTPKLFCYAKLSENLDEIKKYCQCEPIIHIDTCEPQVELITDKIKDLKQQLAELKQKAIVPKFDVGQEVWVNDWTGQLRIGRIYEVQANAVLHDQQLLITYLVDFYGNYEDDDQENDYYEEKDVFATKEEAQAKLRELQGEKK